LTLPCILLHAKTHATTRIRKKTHSRHNIPSTRLKNHVGICHPCFKTKSDCRIVGSYEKIANSESNARVYLHWGKTSTMMLTPPVQNMVPEVVKYGI